MTTNDNLDGPGGGFSRNLAAILTAIATIVATVAGVIALWHRTGDAVPGPSDSPSVSLSASASPSRIPGGALDNIQPKDCLPYNPGDLRIVDEGASGWLLTDGRSRMLTLDNRTDAVNALALAQRHTQQCFIGRDNRRADRRTYIVDYWAGESGRATTISGEDCIGYSVAGLHLENEGDAGWLLTDGRSRMLMLDNPTDGNNALTLARAFTKQCYIGRGNHRSDRSQYIVEYWR
jgi:hypothetical protein